MFCSIFITSTCHNMPPQSSPTFLPLTVTNTSAATATMDIKGGSVVSSYFQFIKNDSFVSFTYPKTGATDDETTQSSVTSGSSFTDMDQYNVSSLSSYTNTDMPTNISKHATINSSLVVESFTSMGVTHPVSQGPQLTLPTPSASENMTDSTIGAFLQVLLHKDSLDDATSNEAVTRGQRWAGVTTDMQYSILGNITNFTVDFFTNTSYHGPGSSDPSDGSQFTIQSGRYSIPEGILIGIILSLIIFFSVAGNVVVCAAILSDRNLRKTSNYFIISLAVADMLVASMVMSFAVANDILGYWIFGKTFCSVWISLDIMCSTASILNLCAISLDRYIHIRSPLHYELWVTPVKTCVFISAIWVLSGLMSFVPIHLGWHQLGLSTEPTEKPPSDDTRYICVMELNPWYAVISSIVSFYMPCIVMIAIYLKLYAYARRHVASIKTQIRTPMLQNGTSSKSKQSNSKVADHKAAITLGVIMGTFLFCWTPFFTINIVGAFCSICIPTVVFQVFSWLGYFNSTLNPIIYSIFNAEFRNAFKRVLSFRRCCSCCDRETDFRHTIDYNESGAYGTVSRKGTYSYTAAAKDKVTAV